MCARPDRYSPFSPAIVCLSSIYSACPPLSILAVDGDCLSVSVDPQEEKRRGEWGKK